MKKLSFSLFSVILFLGMPVPLCAQYFVGDISINRRQLSVIKGDTLRLELEFMVRNRAVNSCQSWTFVPELSLPDNRHEYFFPRVIVNGKNKRRMEEPRQRLTHRYWKEKSPYQIVNTAKDGLSVVDYVADVPYEEWMGEAALTLQGVLTSCGNKQQLLSLPLDNEILYPYRTPYDPHVTVAFCEPASEIKQRTVRGEAYLDFQVGRSVILPNFRDNGEELAKIRAIIDQIRRDGDMTITDVFIEGYASPEGRYDLNARLSQSRAEALKEYLCKTYSFPDEIFHVTSVAEDWDGLRQLIEQSDLPSRDRILTILDSDQDFDRKEYSLKMLGSNVWKTLLANFFPQLRHVDYQIKYNLKNYDLADAQVLAERAPEKLSHLELFRLAQSRSSDSLYRWRIFDQALALYPKDPVANINAAASYLQQGDLDSARKCLDYVAGVIQTLDVATAAVFANNEGVRLLKENRLEQAEQMLRRAADAGRAEARINLVELEKKRNDNRLLERYKQATR